MDHNFFTYALSLIMYLIFNLNEKTFLFSVTDLFWNESKSSLKKIAFIVKDFEL